MLIIQRRNEQKINQQLFLYFFAIIWDQQLFD